MNIVWMANPSIRGDMDANKENADHIHDLIANARGTAITAMAAHVSVGRSANNVRRNGGTTEQRN